MSSVRVVLVDQDGILVEGADGGDPDRVRPVPGAREALGLLRSRGVRTGVLTRRPDDARGRPTEADRRRVDERIDELLGPFDVRAVRPSTSEGDDGDDGGGRTAPGPLLWAAGRLCTPPERIAVVGASRDSVEAARRAGAHGILVPGPGVRPEETADALHVAPDLLTAVRGLLLSGPPKQHVLVDERAITAAYRPVDGAG
ncbi:HAD hydrolase-like protein [Streptomyces sp. NPDC006172]|uniref:HAD hydrolase-like protein n=1 Tax=Streptomyces sp. NPDC006172 TaxID=3154470 RepID=UPI0033F31DCF